jgi:phage head maturation protease
MPDTTTDVDRYFDALADVRENDARISIRSAALREIDMRLVPWEVPVITRDGPEVHMRGSFNVPDPSRVVLRLEHDNPPAGKGIAYEDRADGAYMTFRVSRTQRGDDILTLAQDGVTTGVSAGFYDRPDGVEIHSRGGNRLRIVKRGGADLREASTTWRPTWDDATVLAVRSPEGDRTVTETALVPAEPVINIDTTAIAEVVGQLGARLDAQTATLAEFRHEMAERSRADIVIPGIAAQPAEGTSRGDWLSMALRVLSGERVPQEQLRAWSDLITTDNLGVVPPAHLSEMIGVISAARPFLSTTRQLNLPASGMSLILPQLVTRPTVGIQATEKTLITSTETSITPATFSPVTIAGGGDISLQLLRRSDPSYLTLYLELLAEALSANAESTAITALLATAVDDGGTIDPELLALGDAWATSYGAMKQGPDTIWMSSAAIGAFIDAKASTTNQPLYSDLRADFTAAGGVGGSISGLRPVHVPALDATAVDVLVGNHNGFAWGEDGAYNLQVDVPSKLGRDVALASIFFFAPLYPASFTKYALGA